MSYITQLARLQEVNFKLIRNNYHSFMLWGTDTAGALLSLSGARLRMQIKSVATEDAPVVKEFDSDSASAAVKLIIVEKLHDGEYVQDSAVRIIFTEDSTETELPAGKYYHQVDFYTSNQGRKYSIFKGTITIEEQAIQYPTS